MGSRGFIFPKVNDYGYQNTGTGLSINHFRVSGTFSQRNYVFIKLKKPQAAGEHAAHRFSHAYQYFLSLPLFSLFLNYSVSPSPFSSSCHPTSLLKASRNARGPLRWLRLTTTQHLCCGSRQTQSLRAATLWKEEEKVKQKSCLLRVRCAFFYFKYFIYAKREIIGGIDFGSLSFLGVIKRSYLHIAVRCVFEPYYLCSALPL